MLIGQGKAGALASYPAAQQLQQQVTATATRHRDWTVVTAASDGTCVPPHDTNTTAYCMSGRLIGFLSL